MEPPATGLTAVVSKYCVVNAAVKVAAAAGATTEWDAACPSDQEPKTYCVPAAPACVAAATVWVEAWIHWNEHGVVQGTLSTVRASPAGELVTVIATVD